MRQAIAKRLCTPVITSEKLRFSDENTILRKSFMQSLVEKASGPCATLLEKSARCVFMIEYLA